MVRNNIHKTAIIYPGVQLGSNVTIGPYCTIGAPPESKEHPGKGCGVIIGDNVKITGHVTIDAGTDKPTVINAGCYIMKHAHIGHDAVLENNCTISPHASIGGHAVLMRGVNVGMNAAIHQYCVIPEWCMIGAGSFVNNKGVMEPFGIYGGVPARYIKENTYPKEKGLI